VAAELYYIKRRLTLKKSASVRYAGLILLVSFSLLFVFHVLVMTGIVQPGVVWGGHVESSRTNLILFELVALAVTLLFLFFIAVKTGLLNLPVFTKIASLGMWIVFAYMLLNTAANLASGVFLEKIVFAPLTILLALCALRLALEKHTA